MEIVADKIGDVAVVVLPVEELDAANTAEFKRDIAPVLEQSARIVFDLGRLRFIDSSGLGAFISCLRKVNAKGGDVKLCGMSKQVRTVFELVRMHRILDIHETREAAIAAFSGSPPRDRRRESATAARRGDRLRGSKSRSGITPSTHWEKPGANCPRRTSSRRWRCRYATAWWNGCWIPRSGTAANPKCLAYLSIEFLLGQSLGNNLINLGLRERVPSGGAAPGSRSGRDRGE